MLLTRYHNLARLFNILKLVQYAERSVMSEEVFIEGLQNGKQQVKSVVRVLDILEHLARSDRELSLTEIATALKLPKSSTYLLLQTLASRGYLEASSSSGPFQLGLQVMELAGAYTRKAGLLQKFPAVARAMVAACEETVQLAVLSGVEVVYLGKEDGTKPVRLVSDIGKRLPAHATALGKVLLAALSDAELEARFAKAPLVQMTPKTITSLDSLKKELAIVRANRYAIDDEEVVEGLCCFAAPVYDSSGKVAAAISVAVPKNRVCDRDFEYYVALIQHAANELSRRIGYVAIKL